MSNMDEENLKHVKSIAEELEKIASREYYKIDGECVDKDSIDDDDENDYEEYTIWDYFADCLDIEYVVHADKTYKGVRVMITCGGPNIYVNTMTNKVELYWWSDEASYPISKRVADEIDTYFEDLYNCC